MYRTAIAAAIICTVAIGAMLLWEAYPKTKTPEHTKQFISRIAIRFLAFLLLFNTGFIYGYRVHAKETARTENTVTQTQKT